MTEKEKLEIESDIIQSLIDDDSIKSCIYNIHGQLYTIKNCLATIACTLNQTVSALENSSQSIGMYSGLYNNLCNIYTKINELKNKENETDNRN